MTTKTKDEAPKRPKLIEIFADRYHVDALQLLPTLKATAFRLSDGEVSTEQMMALLLVANEYHLNPFTREIYAYPDKSKGIVPVVSVDGWIRIIQDHPQFKGVTFAYSPELIQMGEEDEHPPCFEWIEVTIYRKDKDHPTVIREFFDECYRGPFTGKGRDGQPYTKPGPWQSHPKRMLRHKSLIQCARVAFGFGGIFDEDEAQRIVDSSVVAEVPAGEGVSRTDLARSQLQQRTGALEGPKVNLGDELLKTIVPQKQAEAVGVPRGAKAEPTQQETMPWEAEDPQTGARQTLPTADDSAAGSFDDDIPHEPRHSQTTQHTDSKSWEKDVLAAKTRKALDEVWTKVLLSYDAASKEVPMDLEAAFQYRKEYFQENT